MKDLRNKKSDKNGGNFIFCYVPNINFQLIIADYSMEASNEDIEKMKQNRVTYLRSMLEDQKTEVLKKVYKLFHQLTASKKFRSYKATLDQSTLMVNNFVTNTSDAFFTMLQDEEYLMLTTETDVIQKVQKFKKNIFNSLHKVTSNLQEKPDIILGLMSQNKPCQSQQSQGNEMISRRPKTRSKMRTRSKNFKISAEASRAMMEWLLANFDKPYPSTIEKQRMAREGKISLAKVNNWFINARERTVKNYFQAYQ